MTPHVAAGSYGQVYKGTLQLENNTEIEVAVKVLKSKIEKDFKEFRSEIGILKKLNHPNIVKFYNSGEWQGSLYFVIEWCPGGSLESLMLKKKGPFSEEEARVLFKSLAQGLQYVHDQNIAHRDLKPDNILLGSDNELKITDFGLSKIMMADNLTETREKGTGYYMPLEMLDYRIKQYDATKSDVWSAGLTLWKLLKNQEFWYKAHNFKVLEGFLHEFKGLNGKQLEGLSQDLQELFDLILKKDFQDRPTMDQILSSKWLTQQPQDLSMTTSKLMSAYIENQADTLIKYIKLAQYIKLIQALQNYEKTISRLYQETLEYLNFNLYDKYQQQLQFAILVKLMYLINMPFKNMSFYSKNIKKDIKIEECLSKEVLDAFIRTTDDIKKSLNDKYKVLQFDFETDEIQVEKSNPDALLIEFLIKYFEKNIYNDVLNKDNVDFVSIYMGIGLSFKVLCTKVDFLKSIVKVDYEKLKEMRIFVTHDEIGPTISKDRHDSLLEAKEASKLSKDEGVNHLWQKLESNQVNPVEVSVYFRKNDNNEELYKKLSPLALALYSRIKTMKTFPGDKVKKMENYLNMFNVLGKKN